MKLAKELNRTFSKEEIQMTKKTNEKILNTPNHKGNSDKNYVNIPSSTLRTQTTANVGEDVEKKGTPYTAGGNVS
jgi:hypothetical protein